MLWYHYVFGAVLILASIIITIVVLMQEGRSQNLSGAIAGGAETFLGKSKGRTIEAKLLHFSSSCLSDKQTQR